MPQYTERLFAAESNYTSCTTRLDRAWAQVSAARKALGDAEAELDAAQAEADALPDPEPLPPAGLHVAAAGAGAHAPTVITEDYIG